MTAGRSDLAPRPNPPSGPPTSRRVLGVVVAGFCGVALATQSRVNGELGNRVHDGIAAALISFGVGLVVLAVLVVALPSGRRGIRRVSAALRGRAGAEVPPLRFWHTLGGVSGAFLVITQGTVAAVLGVAIFTVALVGGQSATSLLVDRIGLGPAGPQRVTVLRVLGAVLAVVAVVIAVADRLGVDGEFALALLPAMAGIGTAFQQAITGRVSATAAAPMTAAFINFLAGTMVLVLALAVDVAIRGLPGPLPVDPVLYLGGLLGIVFIGGAAWVVHWTGVLLLGMASVAGQLIGALLLDLVLPVAGEHLAVNTFVGTGLTLVAVLLAAAPGRARR